MHGECAVIRAVRVMIKLAAVSNGGKWVGSCDLWSCIDGRWLPPAGPAYAAQ